MGRIGVASATPDATSEPDPIEDAADGFLDDWVELVEPIIGPIEELLATSTSLASFRDGLAGRIGAMDDSAVAERAAS